MAERLVVRKLDYRGAEIFRWIGDLVERTEERVVVEAAFNVERVDLGYVVLERGDLFVEFYYFQRWFNVFQVYSRRGDLKGWYCNLSTPARLSNGELTYRDLALDVFVRPDWTWVEDDRDEYEANRAALYTPDDARAAERGLAELMAWVRARRLPARPIHQTPG